MQKSILIIYNEDDWIAEKPNYSLSQEISYNLWGTICNSIDVDLYRASLEWFNNDHFIKGWIYNNNKWNKIVKKIKPSVVYDKTASYEKQNGELLTEVLKTKINIERNNLLINTTNFDTLFDNKLNQAIIFKAFMPQTTLVSYARQIKNIDKKLMVIKNLRGSGGKQVNITNEEIININHPSLIQEFVEARSDGILKDTRVVFLGEIPQYALSRVAREDSYYTNFHQGARIKFLDLSKLDTLLSLCNKINEKLKIFEKKIFSLDFMIDAKKDEYLLIEMNTKPGLDVFENKDMEILKAYLSNLTNYLLN